MLTKIDWIKSQLLPKESASNTASRLNTTGSIPNPAPQSQTPKPIDLIALRASIPDLEAFKVLSSPIWDRITAAIAIGDTVTVLNHVQAMFAGGLITQETVGIIAPLMAATQPDPNWQARLIASSAQLAGYDLVLVGEVQEAIDAKAA